MSAPIHRGRKIRLAVVGMGKRATGLVRHLRTLDAAAEIALVVDTQPAEARKRLTSIDLGDDVEIIEDIQQLIDRADSLHGIIIGTRCNLHTPIACQLAATGLPLFLEKPVALDWRQLQQLQAAFQGRGDRIVVSFPLRRTPHVRTALEILASGRLGTINQIQAVNNVAYGGVYFSQPYREYDLTGGLWLQKATHDFDYLHLLMASQPRTIAAMHSRRVFGGDMPHDLHCS